MCEEKGIEKHIFTILPPSDWHGKGDETVDFFDYINSVDGHPERFNINELLPACVKVINAGASEFDNGRAFVEIYGSREYVDRLMNQFAYNFNSHLKNISKKNHDIELRYDVRK